MWRSCFRRRAPAELRSAALFVRNSLPASLSADAHPRPGSVSSSLMKRVVTALILIPLVLLLVFLGPGWLFTLAIAAVAALAAWEFLGLAEKAGATPPRIAVVLAVLALFASNLKWPIQNPATLGMFGILSLGLLVYCTFFRPVKQLMADASASIFCLIYIGFTLLVLPALRENQEGNGPSLVTFLPVALSPVGACGAGPRPPLSGARPGGGKMWPQNPPQKKPGKACPPGG